MKKGYILTVIASCVGVAITAYATAKCHEKALESIHDVEAEQNCELSKTDKLRVSAKHYIPAFIAGGLTCGVIVYNTVVSKKYGASAAALVAAGGGVFEKYRDLVKRNYGDDVDKELYKQSLLDSTDLINDAEYVSELRKSMDEADNYDDLALYYDGITNTYFTATWAFVDAAIYKFLRMFHEKGWADLGDWVRTLGLEASGYENLFGWEKQSQTDDLCIIKREVPIDGDFHCICLYPSRDKEELQIWRF